MNFAGKRLLILGGTYQHIKLVESAKKNNIITYVVDWNDEDKSPAKKIADDSFLCDINDINKLVKICIDKKIDGVLCAYLDAAQRPYSELCRRMGYYCFADVETFKKFTDKKKFSDFLRVNNFKVIKQYEENDQCIDYPVIVKPTDSRGSRGQFICNNYEEVQYAINDSKKYSKNGKVIIQEYIENGLDIELEYLVVEKTPILISVADRCVGSFGSGIETLNTVSLMPSVYFNNYIKEKNEYVKRLINRMNLTNAPIFLQGIVSGNDLFFYDPGIRFMGDDRHLLWRGKGIDIPEILISFALSGRMDGAKKLENFIPDSNGVLVYPAIRPGKVKRVDGFNKIKENKNILSYYVAYNEGDIIEEFGDLRQRYGEFVIKGKNNDEIIETVKWLFDVLKVLDQDDNDMLFEKYNVIKMHDKFKEEWNFV